MHALATYLDVYKYIIHVFAPLGSVKHPSVVLVGEHHSAFSPLDSKKSMPKRFAREMHLPIFQSDVRQACLLVLNLSFLFATHLAYDLS